MALTIQRKYCLGCAQRCDDGRPAETIAGVFLRIRCVCPGEFAQFM
jgi:hypothetical protein